METNLSAGCGQKVFGRAIDIVSPISLDFLDLKKLYDH